MDTTHTFFGLARYAVAVLCAALAIASASVFSSSLFWFCLAVFFFMRARGASR